MDDNCLVHYLYHPVMNWSNDKLFANCSIDIELTAYMMTESSEQKTNIHKIFHSKVQKKWPKCKRIACMKHQWEHPLILVFDSNEMALIYRATSTDSMNHMKINYFFKVIIVWALNKWTCIVWALPYHL